LETQTPSQKEDRAKIQFHLGYKLIFRFLVGIAALFACFFTLFAFNVNLPYETSTARQQWQRANISNYEIHYGFGSFNYIGDVFVTVTDGVVTRLEQPVTPILSQPTVTDPVKEPAEALPAWYTGPYGFDRFLPADLNHYSVDGLLDFWEQTEAQISRPLLEICSSKERYQVRFNAEYGYIESLSRTNCGYGFEYGLGLMCPAIGDCTASVTAVGFKVIEPTDE